MDLSSSTVSSSAPTLSRRGFLGMTAAGLALAGAAKLAGTPGVALADDGKTVNLAVQTSIMSLDPLISGDAVSMSAISNCVEALFDVDPDGQIQPAACESYEVSDDQLTYTFHLRDGLTWSNGEPVTAQDFIYAWQRNASSDGTAAQFQYQIEMAAIKNYEAVLSGEADVTELGCSAIDEKTIEVTLEHPVAFLLNLLSFTPWVPVNQAFCESQGDQFGVGKDNILFSGPYVLDTYSMDNNTITLKKNPNYWDAANVDIETVNLQVIADTQQAVMSYEMQTVDYVELTGDLVSQYEGTEGFESVPGPFNYYLMINVTKPGYDNQDFRQAIAYSIDREALCNDVLRDGSQPAYTMTMKGLCSNSEGKDFAEDCTQYFAYDTAKAQELWAGCKDELGIDAITIVYDQEKDFAQKSCEFMQSALQSTLEGLTVNIESTPKKNRLQMEQDHDYEIVLHGWGPDYADPTAILAMYESTHPSNYSLWASEDFDTLYEKANTEDSGDEAARWEDLKQCADICTEAAVCPPIFQTGSATLTRPTLTGHTYHMCGVKCFYKYMKLA